MRKILLVTVVIAVGGGIWKLGTGRAEVSATQLQLRQATALEGPYRSEVAWSVGETIADLKEMAVAATKGPAPEPTAAVDLTLMPWTVEQFIPIARQALGQTTAKPGPPLNLHEQLTKMTTQVLTDADSVASRALADDMRNPSAHEAAAVTLAAFAMREAAGKFDDPRWALNRITAHLAFAGALRNGALATVDGELARAALFVLSDHHAKALAVIAGVESRPHPTEAINAWTRAIRMRATDDWRLLATPASASRLEKLEYFRARRTTLEDTAGSDLRVLVENPSLDFVRIIESTDAGVEDGNEYVTIALDLEREALPAAHQVVRGAVSSQGQIEALNARATRLITATGPQVLPWGAWAESFQRHLGLYTVAINYHFRYMQGHAKQAGETNLALDKEFGALRLYPLATTLRSAGPAGETMDSTLINEAVAVAARVPELITFREWVNLEVMASTGRSRAMMAPGRTWFRAPSAAMPYEVGARSGGGATFVTLEGLGNLVAEAPSDQWLLAFALDVRPATHPIAARGRALVEARLDYDARALNLLARVDATEAERLAWDRRSCAFNPAACLDVAWRLRTSGDEAAAAKEYEEAFKNPRLDALRMANAAPWLVTYYYRQKRIEQALSLAKDAAQVGSSTGLVGLAYLYERLGRLDDAEEWYVEDGDHYKDIDELLGFYYRQGEVLQNPAFKQKWIARSKEVFPRGLEPVPATMVVGPPHGVRIQRDTWASRAVHIQTGDIIVGLDGVRVENRAQLRAIVALKKEDDVLKLTLWRGGLFTADLKAERRIHGLELRDF